MKLLELGSHEVKQTPDSGNQKMKLKTKNQKVIVL